MRVASSMTPRYDVELRWSAEDSCYVARVSDLPGCTTHGDTLESAALAAEEAITAYIESLEARGLPLPQPSRR